MRELARGRNATALLCAVALVTVAFIAGGDSTAGAFGAKTTSLKRMATATAFATGPDGTAPTKPSRLRIEATTASSLTVSWRRSTDRVGVTGYTVYRDGTRLGASSASTLRYIVSGLACGRSYEIGVEAYDLAGNTSARATILAPTSACTDTVAPSAPPSVSQVGVTATSITVAWSLLHRQRRRRRLRRPPAGSPRRLDRFDAVRGHVAPVRDDVHDRRSRLRRER